VASALAGRKRQLQLLLEFRECLCEVINTDVMEERGELLLLPLPCCLPYARRRL
jgi:hypothetical protein